MYARKQGHVIRVKEKRQGHKFEKRSFQQLRTGKELMRGNSKDNMQCC